MKNILLDIFLKVYGDTTDVEVYFAPGRVNLIGEHTDYNGGHVFPCALSIGTYAAVRLREDQRIHLYSENIPEVGVTEVECGKWDPVETADWCNYPIGVMWALEKNGIKITKGMDIVFYGNIPSGSGLSSSASIEVLTAYMLREELGFDMSLIDIALLCQYSENHFNGMRCGIMDQFASAMGKKDHAIFLDTATLSYEYAPIKLEGKKIVIINSNKKHKLCDSKYNERREESENALKALQAAVDIESLGELNENDFEKYKESIKDSVERRRAKHAVYENQRTIQAVKALKEDDIKTFGELMVASHRSLQYDYETSCQENDIIVEETLKQKGVWGVRITGGGFGGCCVSIIDEACVDDVIREVGDAYKERTGLQASFYIEEIGDGPHKLVGNKG